MIMGNSVSEKFSKEAGLHLGILFVTALIIFYSSIYINSFINIQIPRRVFLLYHVFSELSSSAIAITVFVVLYFTFDIFK